MIRSGQVEINGEKVTQPYFQVNEKEIVTLAGKPVLPVRYIYLALNKPVGYTCTIKDRFARKKVVDLVPKSLGRLFPVGRLDRNSSGLVILTNDGIFAEKLAHPRYQVDKEYRITIVPSFRPKDAARLVEGVEDDGEKLVAKQVRVVSQSEGKSVLSLVLAEGKKREIRRMFSVLHYHVLRLERVRVGHIRLGVLKPGQYRHLRPEEVYFTLKKSCLLPRRPNGRFLSRRNCGQSLPLAENVQSSGPGDGYR
ncbi:MAG: pseudouridine synthase [Candidatus Omnitrophica bacterium]|nr:pseudouridine synthase [Candidatus Omnitrophota bacterium]